MILANRTGDVKWLVQTHPMEEGWKFLITLMPQREGFKIGAQQPLNQQLLNQLPQIPAPLTHKHLPPELQLRKKNGSVGVTVTEREILPVQV